jgi:hypothetical protein
MSWGIIFRQVSLTLLKPLRSRLWPACSNLNLGTWPRVHPICRNTIPRTYTGFQTSCVPLLQIKTKYVVPSTSLNHHLVGWSMFFGAFHYHFGPVFVAQIWAFDPWPRWPHGTRTTRTQCSPFGRRSHPPAVWDTEVHNIGRPPTRPRMMTMRSLDP